MKNVTVLFPGGFKPITGAHMALAQRYAQNSNVDRVIMLIGPKERDGITRDKSIKMFNLLNRNNNIEIQPTNFNSPIMAAYEYLFNLPKDTQGRFALAASEKDDDYVRVKSFIPNVDKYKTVGDRSGRKIPIGVDAIELTVSVDPLKYEDGDAISASAVRAALNADAYSKFKASYPNYDESIVKNIWQMLGGAPTYGDVMGQQDDDIVTADEWNNFSYDQKENALLTAVQDPDDVYNYIDKDFNDLPPEVTSNMRVESVGIKEWFLREFEKDADELFTELRTGKRLRVFDFDDTLSKMNATIYVTHKDGTQIELNPAEFAVYEPRPGDNFDFKDFDKIIKGATPISVNIDALKQAHRDPGAKTTILTARAIGYPVKRYLEKEHGLKNIYVVALGSSNPMDKAKWIEDQIKKGYDDIYFIDDSAKNIAAVKTLINKYPEVNMDIELAEQMAGGYMTPKGAVAHDKKIKKLRKFLDKKNDRGFVYDFDKYPKTIFGTPYLNEGGLAGHMAHPFDKNKSQSLTFADFKEMIARGLQGRLDIENTVTEKTDGQNIFMTVKDGQVKFARNGGERVNPLTVKELQAKFAGRGNISDAFGEAGTDLAAAFSRVGMDKLNSIFQNGKVFANMEIIYPPTKNVIAYEAAYLQFHNLVEFDEKGKIVQTDLTGGAVVQKAITDANADLQNTFNLIPPQKIKIGKIENFQDYQDALFKELDQLRDKYNLNDQDTVAEYHKAWWKDVIRQKAENLNYDISEDMLDTLMNRWSFNIKTPRIDQLAKMIDNEEFVEWMRAFDKKDFKQYQKQNVQPFESIFLKLGAEIMKNVSNFLAANPTKAVQDIRKDIAQVIRDLRSTNDISKMTLLKTQLDKIKRLGGFKKIVPVEGIVFVYGGNTYKLTGAFAPINQILGTLKYSR